MDKPYIYVCSPYSGEEDNYQKAIVYSKYVIQKNGIPIIPTTMYHGIFDNTFPEHKSEKVKANKKLLKLCNEVWVFGKVGGATVGMREDISTANEYGIPIKYIDITTVWGADKRSAEIKKCANHFQEVYLSINTAIVHDMVFYLDAGIAADVICESIDVAARKDARWNYSRAVLQGCLERQIFTMDDWNKGKNKKKSNENDYKAYDLELFEKMLNED